MSILAKYPNMWLYNSSVVLSKGQIFSTATQSLHYILLAFS